MAFDPRYQRITRAVLDEPWAITPTKLEAIADFIALKASGGTLTDAEIEALTVAAPPRDQRATGGDGGSVAILPVFGTISYRMNALSAMSGGTSAQLLRQQFAALVRDPGIAAIVLDIDSPGGAAGGITELVADIFAARERKPVVAVANTDAASAAYWIGAAATEFVGTPSALVGSIGVWSMHVDASEHEAREGFKYTFISAGKDKVLGNSLEPLSDDGRAYIQQRVDEVYDTFTADVARFRGVSVEDARGPRFGEGRVISARRALRAGLIDRIATIEETVERLLRPQGRAALMRGMSGAADVTTPIDIQALTTAINKRLEGVTS